MERKTCIKGAESLHDVEKAQKLGLDGVIISNHGGRQVDVGQATVDSLKTILPIYKGKIKIMMDSGIRGGADVARVMATGADFSFMGRTFCMVYQLWVKEEITLYLCSKNN